MLPIDRAAFEPLAALLLDRAGLKIGPDGHHALRLALETRMPALGLTDAGAYVKRLKGPGGDEELRALLPLVTVGKTDFFRDQRQFQALERKVLPELLALARRQKRKLTLWSAGCATGEEPYSLAILLHELGAKPEEVDLLATDVNMAAVENARQGRYPRRRMGGLSPARLARYFQSDGDDYIADPLLRPYVRFATQNLASSTYDHAGAESLDLLLCRNVIIYFDLPTIRRVMDRFLEVLRPEGYLFLGYSESLFKVYDRFEMVEVEGAFVYRRGGQKEAGLPPIPREAPARPSAQRPSLAVKPRAPVPPPQAPAPDAKRSPRDRLDEIAARMNQGQFDEALRALQALSADEPNDLDALLTLGNLEALLGHARESQAAFERALSIEPLCVEARLFAAVAAFQGGKMAEAQNELSKALFLEPSLAILHYLMAQTQERSGDHEGARRAYRNAIAQLRVPQRTLAGHYPDMPDSPEALGRAAKYALAALEEL